MVLKTKPNGYIVGHLDGREIIRLAPLPTNESARLYGFLYGAATQRVKALAEKKEMTQGSENVVEFKKGAYES